MRKKKVPGTGRSPTKARPIGSDRIGSASRIRAPSTASARPKVSHARMNPVTPEKTRIPKSATPVIQARVRGPQVRRWRKMRRKWTSAATTAASEA